MTQTVAVSQHTGQPQWFIKGLAVLARGLAAAGDAASGQVDLGISPRVAKSYARLVVFMQEHYAEYASGAKRSFAGSAAVQELAKIHAIDVTVAHGIADACFAGKLTVNQLRERLARLYVEPTATNQAVRKVGSRRFAEFLALAAYRLRHEALLPFSAHIKELEMVERGVLLAPSLVARSIDGHSEIAIEIRAPRDTAARSVAHVAAELVARFSALRLHYHGAILVMPMEAKVIAETCAELWRSWVRFCPQQWCKMDILLLDEKSHLFIECESKQAVALV